MGGMGCDDQGAVMGSGSERRGVCVSRPVRRSSEASSGQVHRCSGSGPAGSLCTVAYHLRSPVGVVSRAVTGTVRQWVLRRSQWPVHWLTVDWGWDLKRRLGSKWSGTVVDRSVQHSVDTYPTPPVFNSS